jgi:hypothetical protein
LGVLHNFLLAAPQNSPFWSRAPDFGPFWGVLSIFAKSGGRQQIHTHRRPPDP